MNQRLGLGALILLTVAAATPLCGDTWEPDGLAGWNVWALEASPSGVLLAGTATAPDNNVFRSLDSGASWSLASGLPGNEVWAITFDPWNESIVYAGLNGGGVWKSLDGGVTWSWSNLSGQVWEIAVSPVDPQILYVATDSSGAHRSTDGGASWLPLATVTRTTAIAVHPGDPDVALLGTPFDGIFRTDDGGLSWVAVNTGFSFTPDVRSLLYDSADPAIVYAGEMWSGVFKSEDGGTTWSRPDPTLDATVESIHASGGDLYIINTFESNDHPAYRSVDEGLSWQPLARLPGLPDPLWPRSLAVLPNAVMLGTEVDSNPGGIFVWNLPCADGGPYTTDSSTLLLLHLDGSYQGEQGELPLTEAGIFAPGRFGQGIDASSPHPDWLEYDAAGNIATAAGTIEFWIRPNWDGDDGLNHDFFAAHSNLGNLDSLLLKKDAANNFRFLTWDGAEVESGLFADLSDWSAGEWHHVAVTWQTAATQLYLDGELRASGLASFPSGFERISLSGHPGEPFPEWSPDAVVDELRISNRVRCFEPPADQDGDLVPDEIDNCQATPNPAQADTDGDGSGDLCDPCPADPTQSCDVGGSTAEEVSAAEGGSVETPDGSAQLDIDPLDLAENTTISITQTVFNDPAADLSLATGAGLGQRISVYDLEPDGLVFDGPVTLTLTADVSDLGPSQRDKLGLYLDSGGGVFEPIEASCSIAEDPPASGTWIATCTAELTHFSVYAMVAPLDTDGDGIFDLFDGVEDICPAGANVVIGFAPPMDALVPEEAAEVPLPDNAFRAGRTIPLKLEYLCGEAAVTDQDDVDPPELLGVWWVGAAETIAVLDLAVTDESDEDGWFRYSGVQWIYNLRTRSYAPGTYELRLRLPDGRIFKGGFVLR